MRLLLILFILLAVSITIIYFFSSKKTVAPKSSSRSQQVTTKPASDFKRFKRKITEAKNFARQNGFSPRYQFLIDMSLPSGKKRFFVYDALRDTVIHAGLVAHGNCRTKFLEEARFSNVPECGCSSVGKYKIDYKYDGNFGKAFKLRGIEATNSNAFKRNIVLHAYDCVPDEEIFPHPICKSLGCPMVSYQFLNTLTGIIESSKKPILLWIYN